MLEPIETTSELVGHVRVLHALISCLDVFLELSRHAHNLTQMRFRDLRDGICLNNAFFPGSLGIINGQRNGRLKC
jgi:hypothetical protein